MIKLKSLLEYVDTEVHKIGLSPDEEYSEMPVNWNEPDIQCTGTWNIKTVREFAGLPKTFVAIYKSIIDVNELDPQLAEEDPEFNDEGGYDWSEFRMRKRGFPPIVVRRVTSGKIVLMDGNHRTKWAQESGYNTISAWVVDDFLQEHINKSKTTLSESIILTEGRIEDFNEKYKMLQPELRRRIVLNDPSSNKKYIDWIGRIASSEPNTDIEDVLKDVNQFDKYQAALGDIYKLKSYNDLKHVLSTRVKSNKEKTREGANILIDDDFFLVTAPTTHESCAYYGNNTRWCIVASEDWWNNYYYKNSIVIVEDKRYVEKYAVVGEVDYGDYTVYNRDDRTVDYDGMFNTDDEQCWPEYVREAIEDYMSSDDIQSRKDKYEAKRVDDYIKDYGTDTIWENYVYRLDGEYKLGDTDTQQSLVAFKAAAGLNGINEDKLKELALSFLWNQVMEDVRTEDLGEFRSSDELKRSLNDMGNEPKIKDTLEQIDVDYAAGQRNIDHVLEILQQAIPPQEYTRLYNNGTIDEEIFDAITKYNKMLNSKQQQTFSSSKESVQIRNINDIIMVLKRTGHENVAGYLETLIGIKENKTSCIKLKDLLENKLEEVMYPNMVGIHELSLFYDNADLNTQLEVDDLLETGNKEAAWDIIRNFLRTIGKLTFLEEHKDIRNYFI